MQFKNDVDFSDGDICINFYLHEATTYLKDLACYDRFIQILSVRLVNIFVCVCS